LDGDWLVGTGMAASLYPAFPYPGSVAAIRAHALGRYTVSIAAADIGTGAWTALTQIAAEALQATVENIELRIGDTSLPPATSAGCSSGVINWGSAIVEAASQLRARIAADHCGTVPAEGIEVTAQNPENPNAGRLSMHAYGAQFAEVRVHGETGEV